LRAENRVLRARLGPKRLRFAEAERRLLAQKGKPLGRKLLAEMASRATPETILGWYREQVAAKYDGSDPLYTAHFRTLLQAAGVQRLRLPSRSPNLNAYAERFVRAIKHECLRHIIPLGERHLRAVVREFVEHYRAERNHQGLGNVIPCCPETGPCMNRGAFPMAAPSSAGAAGAYRARP
jgi:hypothetical protein